MYTILIYNYYYYEYINIIEILKNIHHQNLYIIVFAFSTLQSSYTIELLPRHLATPSFLFHFL